MDGSAEAIVDKLKVFKQQGLTFYQASQKLKEQGFTDEQISVAGSSFQYENTKSTSLENSTNADGNASLTRSVEAEIPRSEDENLGAALLKDKQNTALNSKFFIYLILFLSGASFGWSLMRLYLIPHWFSPSGPNIFTHSSSYNYSVVVRYNYIYPAIAGIIGGVVISVSYALYKAFTSKPNK